MASSLADSMNETADGDLGALVAVLDGRGWFEQSDLIESGALSYMEIQDNDWSNSSRTGIEPTLAVDPIHFPKVSKDAIDVMNQTLESMHESSMVWMGGLRVRPLPAGRAWREVRKSARQPDKSRGATNQGAYKPVSSLKRTDGLNFGSDEEIIVYRALRARQEVLPSEATIGILPGAALVTPERTFWPDFVVTYRGRAGGIEVDGPHHHGRAAADRSRENFLTDAGLAWMDRITVEDAVQPVELSAFVERFLTRLLAR